MTPMQQGAVQALVMAAYEEGFSDGISHDSVSWKYPPMHVAWLMSQSRKDAGFGKLEASQKATVDAWENR